MSDCNDLRCTGSGTCTQTLPGQLLCDCDSMYEGDQCESVIPNVTYPCENFTTPCSGNGTCYDLSETEYLCVCNAEYNGTDCDVDINECDSNPCFHGNCTDEVNGFSCVCDDGYEGVQCQTDSNECLSSPCGQNATCYDIPNDFFCDCNAGFTGKDCHSICDDSPCFNNGTCTLCAQGYCEDTKLSFHCDCPDDIYGYLCTNQTYPTGR
ncbi:TDGF1 [Bugula neritina]|uniref:TDGF1 n=1 Tax=Bugula neritina TaxID=10212 RepID=A0A7J7J6S2_BUGNE|nr:TDGF1 [Bugula neritina]